MGRTGDYRTNEVSSESEGGNVSCSMMLDEEGCVVVGAVEYIEVLSVMLWTILWTLVVSLFSHVTLRCDNSFMVGVADFSNII